MKHSLLLAITLLFCSYSYAQQKKSDDHSPIISTKKIMLPEGDSLMIPVVSDQYPELKKALSDTNLFFGDKLDNIIKIKRNQDGPLEPGITEFNYEVTFVNKNIISLKLNYNVGGVYPAEYFQKWLTLNIHTGTAYPVSKEINATGLKWICNNYRALLKENILNNPALDEADTAYTNIYKDEIKGLIERADTLTPAEILSHYIFTQEGICFTSEDDGLPDILRNFGPERDWLVLYDELKPYILRTAIVLKKWKR